jgi:hypothetical protein
MRSVLALACRSPCGLLPTPRRCIAPDGPRSAGARCNALPSPTSPRATRCPGGPTHRPDSGWITPPGQKTDRRVPGGSARLQSASSSGPIERSADLSDGLVTIFVQPLNFLPLRVKLIPARCSLCAIRGGELLKGRRLFHGQRLDLMGFHFTNSQDWSGAGLFIEGRV